MNQNQNPKNQNNSLTATTSFTVRFNETDPLGITWHGHYLTYFEDGRDCFGTTFGLHYLDIFHHGFVAPIVNVNCDYKKMLKFKDTAFIETTFVNCHSAKIKFKYKIYLPDTMETVALGSTTQVFLDAKEKKLQLQLPDFFMEWKKKYNLV